MVTERSNEGDIMKVSDLFEIRRCSNNFHPFCTKGSYSIHLPGQDRPILWQYKDRASAESALIEYVHNVVTKQDQRRTLVFRDKDRIVNLYWQGDSWISDIFNLSGDSCGCAAHSPTRTLDDLADMWTANYS